MDALAAKGIIAGVPVSRLLPHDKSAENLLIVAVTECVSDEDMDALVNALKTSTVCTDSQHSMVSCETEDILQSQSAGRMEQSLHESFC